LAIVAPEQKTTSQNHEILKKNNLDMTIFFQIKVSCKQQEIDEKKKCSLNQLALAWVMHKGKDVVPTLGTTEKGKLKSNIRSVAVTLTEEEIEEVEAAVPAEVAGERYHERSMKLTRHHVVSPPFSSWKGS